MNILLVLLLLLGYATTSSAQIYYSSMDEIRREANKGNAQGLYDLGCCYYNGSFGIEQNFKSAVEWFRKAADKGNSNAMYMLGCCYIDEEGVELDYIEGLKYLLLASQRGHKGANSVIRNITGNGHNDWGEIDLYGYLNPGILSDSDVIEYKEMAQKGSAYACLLLGHSYKNKKDYHNAFQYYIAAGKNITKEECDSIGHLSMEICDQIAWCYEHGYGTIRDYRKAIEWYNKSDFYVFTDLFDDIDGKDYGTDTEKNVLQHEFALMAIDTLLYSRENYAPEPNCMIPEVREGLCYLKLKEYETAYNGCFRFGELCNKGDEPCYGVFRNTAHPAMPLWTAEIYYRGLGKTKNVKIAKQIFETICDDNVTFAFGLPACKIAPQIYADACYRLYEIYKEGLGCQKDSSLSGAYYKMALKYGSTSAIYDEQQKNIKLNK